MLAALDGVSWIMGMFLYGAGLRLSECLCLRVKDVDFGRGEVLVREGKGDKDRVTMLPSAIVSRLTAHLERVRTLHAADLAASFGRVALPDALARKYTHADREWGWRGSFPPRPSRLTRARASGAGITCTSPSRSGPSVKQDATLVSRNRTSAGSGLRHSHGPGVARA